MTIIQRLLNIELLLSLAFCFLLAQSGVAQTLQGAQWSPSVAHQDQEFGYSVDVDNDVAVVGAFRDEDGLTLETGAVFVFRYDGDSWGEETKLVASTPANYNWFAWSVAISGNSILVGARGGDERALNAGDATVFRYNGSIWVEEDILTASDGITQDDFGYAVDIDGSVAAVGAPNRDEATADAGAVYVYRYDGGQWMEEAKLTASDAGLQDLFGSAVAIDGDRILVGAFNAADTTFNQAGKLYIFDYDGAQWNESQILDAPDPNNIANLGVSVDLDGDWAIAGAPLNNENGGGSGGAYLYRFNGSEWAYHSKITASDGNGFFLFGTSVAISGARALVGAENWAPSGGNSTGKAYLFEYDAIEDAWLETEGLTAPNGQGGDGFGQDVAIQNEFMLVGAPEYDDPMTGTGAAFAFGDPMVVTSIDRETPGAIFELTAPFPNPASQSTTFILTPATMAYVRASLFDILGREILIAFEGILPADVPRSIEIPAEGLRNGIYLLRIQTESGISTRAVTVLH